MQSRQLRRRKSRKVIILIYLSSISTSLFSFRTQSCYREPVSPGKLSPLEDRTKVSDEEEIELLMKLQLTERETDATGKTPHIMGVQKPLARGHSQTQMVSWTDQSLTRAKSDNLENYQHDAR